MKALLLAGLLFCLGTVAQAANLSINFTQNPTAFNQDANWEGGFSSTATSFSGKFVSSYATTGTANIAIVDQNTGNVLDELMLDFTSNGFDGSYTWETFGGSVVTGLNLAAVPAGFTSVLATGSSLDFSTLVSNLPANITIQEIADSPLAPVPEPASLELIGLGLAGLMAGRRYVMERTA